ncbi:MAG TPA: hypothetical protein VFO85_14905 [Vicinamibacteria bacterium]|nr:hypothetical protein [Vicinamibacteria bacterium]
MTPPRPALTRLDASELTDALFDGLRGARNTHYETMEGADLCHRCWRLVEAFVASMDKGPSVFVDYVRRITDERIDEGFYLPEIQQALSLLEARAWHIVTARSSIGTLVGHLSVVTGTIGAAKDELARVYLAHRQRAQADLALQHTSRLFEGTEAYVEPDTDAAPAAVR